MKQPQILSLFCGCGNFDLGFERAGLKIGMAIDINPSAIETYNHNRKLKRGIVLDLQTTKPELVVEKWKEVEPSGWPTGIIGGAPCQSFSNGNVHQKPDDKRLDLPSRFADILSHFNKIRPIDFFVFENVKGINSLRHKETFGRYKEQFRHAGFDLHEQLLDAADYGVAQKRPRVFVVGLNRIRLAQADYRFPEPTSSNHIPIRDIIGSFPDPVFFKAGMKPDKIPHHPNHWTMRPRSPKFSSGLLKKTKVRGRSFRVLDWEKPSLAVAYGNREIHVHPSGSRRLSILEAMVLQGLPTSYVLKGTLSSQVKQISDSVPNQLGHALAKSIQRILQ